MALNENQSHKLAANYDAALMPGNGQEKYYG